jgi:hypothetical protein
MVGIGKRSVTILAIAALLGFAVSAAATLGGHAPASAQATVPGRARATASVPAPSTPTAIGLSKPLVILYGDSLAWEAEDAFVDAFAGLPYVQVLTRTYGGTAICDWFDEMQADAALAPGAVVLEFSGNALTSCMQDADGRGLTDAAYWVHYRADAENAIAIFASTNTRVFLAGAPVSQRQQLTGDFHGGLVNGMYVDIATHHPEVEYVDAGAAVLDHGQWTHTLPCLRGEPCTGGTDLLDRGFNVVRAPDGGHFCPAAEDAKRGVTATCPVWSSGAYRYGNAMAMPVLVALGR